MGLRAQPVLGPGGGILCSGGEIVQNPRLRRGFSRQDLPSGRFADSKRLQAGRAVFAWRPSRRKQKHGCAFQVPPHTKQLVCFGRKKPALWTRVFKHCAHQDLNLEPTDYESVALTD